MALTPAWFMNGFRREGTPRPLLISTTRACGIFVLSWVVTTSLTGCATAHGPSRVDDRVMSPTWPWSRVAELRPGVGIALSTTRTPLHARIFVSADASEVTVHDTSTRVSRGAADISHSTSSMAFTSMFMFMTGHVMNWRG